MGSTIPISIFDADRCPAAVDRRFSRHRVYRGDSSLEAKAPSRSIELGRKSRNPIGASSRMRSASRFLSCNGEVYENCARVGIKTAAVSAYLQ